MAVDTAANALVHEDEPGITGRFCEVFPTSGIIEMDVLRGMALFVEVARARSFTRAAERLAIPTSTLSRRIGDIERSLGQKLLHRTTRSVSLTDVGALYFSRAVSLVDAAEEAHKHVRVLAERPAGLLRISMEAEIGPPLIAPVIADFRSTYPDVHFELDLSPRRVDLLSENYDVAIRLGALPDSDLTVRRLALMQVNLFASPGYVAARGHPGHPSALTSHARIHLLHQHHGGDWIVTKDGETVTVPSDRVISANNMSMILQLARAGAGIAVVDEILARREVEAGRLVPILADWCLPSVAISLLTPGRILPVKTRLFVDLLCERVAGLIGRS